MIKIITSVQFLEVEEHFLIVYILWKIISLPSFNRGFQKSKLQQPSHELYYISNIFPQLHRFRQERNDRIIPRQSEADRTAD